MTKKIVLLFSALLCLNFISLAQVTLPYASGFDNTSQQNGWTEYKKAATQFSHWSYATSGAFSNPRCIQHDFSPSTGITVTDNWFVSPGFSLSNGGMLDSIRYKFSGFSQPAAGDTVAIYLLHGSSDPANATQTLLYDFRGNNYIADNTYRLLTEVELSAADGLSYLAIRYRNSNCSSNWMTVFFDNIAISGNGTVAITEPTAQSVLEVFPNPVQQTLNLVSPGGMYSIRITNERGQIVNTFTQLGGVNRYEINCSSWAQGIYFVEVSSDEGVSTHRVIRNGLKP